MAMYRINDEHPRRPGLALRVSDRDGNVIGISGDILDGDDLGREMVRSLLDNGFVTKINAAAAMPKRKPSAPASTPKRTTKKAR